MNRSKVGVDVVGNPNASFDSIVTNDTGEDGVRVEGSGGALKLGPTDVVGELDL